MFLATAGMSSSSYFSILLPSTLVSHGRILIRFSLWDGTIIHPVCQSDCEGRRTSFARINDLSSLPFLISTKQRVPLVTDIVPTSPSIESKETQPLEPVDRHRTEAILTPFSPFHLLFTRDDSFIEKQLRKERSDRR